MENAAPAPGTIDITNVISSLKSSFLTWATGYVLAQELMIPGLQWLGLPIISYLNRALTKSVLNLLVNSTIMEAFFLNTAIKKASQAQDYIDTLNIKNNLPPTASNEEFENAEKREMAAFRNLVLLTS